MLRITEQLQEIAEPSETLTLTYELRQKSRLRTCLDNGEEVVLMLPRGTAMAHGNLLRADDGQIIEVHAAKESVSTVYTDDPLLKARACYHLGNRHVAIQIGDHWIRYLSDHVLDKMIQDVGLTVVYEETGFEPEHGAYSHYDQDMGPLETTAKNITDKFDRKSTVVAFNSSVYKTAGQSLLHLIRLASPALPVGAYAYSQGLESAVDKGMIKNEADVAEWIEGLLDHTMLYVDVPLFARLYTAWQNKDSESVCNLSSVLQAHRESAELLAEDKQLGIALARLLSELGICEATPWMAASYTTYAALFSLASVRWNILLNEAISGYLWSWCESQVAAAIKLVPLGQTAGQRILCGLINKIPKVVESGLAVEDHDIGFSAPGLGIFSALHETQYSRLFRS